MSDIIDSLRGLHDYVPIGSGQHEIQVTMLAAADELERLRARDCQLLPQRGRGDRGHEGEPVTTVDLGAIRARDAETPDHECMISWSSQADRRALLAYVDDLREAADALEAKDREIATLTYERDGWKREDEAECEENKRLLADNASLTVDRDGLASKLNEAIELLREAYTALRHPDTVLLEQRIYSALKEQP